MHPDHYAQVQEKMLVEMENCRVLVSDQKIEQMKDIIPVLEQITRQNQPLLIVTEDITGKRLDASSSLQQIWFGHAHLPFASAVFLLWHAVWPQNCMPMHSCRVNLIVALLVELTYD